MTQKLRAKLGVAGASVAALLTLALAVAVAPAQERRPLITGSLDRAGTVIARGGGKTRSVRTGRRFKLRPPARVVTIRVRARNGADLGPLVVGRRGARAIVGVRAGTSIGPIRVRRGYVVPARRLPARLIAGGRTTELPEEARPVSREERTPTGTRDAGTSPAPRSSEDELLGIERDDLALGLGATAAALALLSLALQLRGLLARRRKRVEVDVRLGLPLYHDGAGQWAVFIEVFNRTDHAIRWTATALELKDGRRAYLFDYPGGGELPAVIQPHESHETWIDCARLERSGLSLDQPVAAAVKTDSGDLYRSKRRRLRRST